MKHLLELKYKKNYYGALLMNRSLLINRVSQSPGPFLFLWEGPAWK